VVVSASKGGKADMVRDETILLVEDNPDDELLTRRTLKKSHVATTWWSPATGRRPWTTCSPRASEAEELFQQGHRTKALGQVAVAFARISDEHKRAIGVRGRLPRLGTSRASYEIGGVGSRVKDPTVKKILGQLIKQVEAINKDFPAFSEAVEVVSLGLDHRRYGAFKRLTPTVLRTTTNGGYEVGPHWDRVKDEDVTEEAYRFCFDFVLENAIRLQEEHPAVLDIERFRRPGVRVTAIRGLSEDALRRMRDNDF
jgi:hypothetical protein